MRTTHLCFSLLALVFAAEAPAQTFDRQVILRGLAAPTGITAVDNGDVYFTEVPTPGVMGGSNRVSRKDGASGQIATVATGEPEPVNLTMDPNTGDVFWTCKSAGVVLRRSNGQNAVLLRGLSQPSGISAPGNGKLYLTQVPTPGVPGSMGGSNTVDVVDLATLAMTTLSSGEPEPADVVADATGNAYWTCKTAGVILRYDAGTAAKAMLLNGLDQPSGIALDRAGRLYFTEVPSPGTAGADNRVWQYEPANANLTLISVGEPEPVDVTVTPDGSTVYWTCRTAGVVLRARRVGSQPVVTSPSTFALGETVRLFFDAGPAAAGQLYMAASSAGIGPITVGTRHWALAMDMLFLGTFANPGTPAATGYFGLLDLNGMATAHLVIPTAPALQGLDVFSGFAVLAPAAPFGVDAFSSTHRFEIR